MLTRLSLKNVTKSHKFENEVYAVLCLLFLKQFYYRHIFSEMFFCGIYRRRQISRGGFGKN